MPHHKSTIKRLRQSKQLRESNRKARSEMRTLSKKTRSMAENGDTETGEALREAQSIIDRLAKRGILKRTAAARRKSRLARYVNTNAAKGEDDEA